MSSRAFDFRTTVDFRVVARRLEDYCRISPELASKRLHAIKQAYGFGGADNVIFDFTGGVYHPFTRELMGSLTAGGARELA